MQIRKHIPLACLLAALLAGLPASRVRGDAAASGYLYLSPQPGSEYLPTQTRYVLVRLIDLSPFEVTNLSNGFISVTGSVSGAHSGQIRVAGDGRTIQFEMAANFSGGELVTVRLNPVVDPGASGSATPFAYQFVVSGHFPGPPPAPSSPPAVETSPMILAPELLAPPPEDPPPPLYEPAGIFPNGVSVPSDFPRIGITVNDNPDAGYIFINNWGGQPYNVIFDNTGSPIWYLRTPDRRRDFKVQRNGLMTMLVREGYPFGMGFIGFDTNYAEVASYHAVNGYETDEHELVVLEDGTYFCIGLHWEPVDMSRYLTGGRNPAWVGETVLQEFTAAGELIFQWRAWDHYDVRDVVVDNPRSSSFRFPHMNAIDVDQDGHLLVSCRHLGEVTKIHRDSGEILWRLDGAHSDFTFVGDAPLNGFNAQHAVRSVGTNRYTLFDNGNLHSPAVSRAVEYELDLTHMTATVVWQFRDTPDRFSYYMANAQRLPNGNTLINWALGDLPKLTEVRPNGTKAFEMNWADQHQTYRTWRHPWQGRALKPYLLVEPAEDNVTLIFNQFGDPAVDHYRIYGGISPAPTNLLATSAVTLKELTNVTAGQVNYFRVTSVSTNGNESDFSNEVSLYATFALPNVNLVANGDFSQGKTGWIWALQTSGVATWDTAGGVAHFDITSGGGDSYSVQLRQNGIPLIQGRDYYFAYDAWSVAPRTIEAKVSQDGGAYVNYSGIQPRTISPVPTRHEYRFTMNDPSDYSARVVFNAGLSTSDVFIDNVTVILLEYLPGDFNEDGCVNALDLEILAGEWLQSGGGLQADLSGDGTVDFRDYAEFMQHWREGVLCP